MTYTFTAKQLTEFLDNTIALFLEYRDQHDRDEVGAQLFAVSEAMEALDIDQEMVKVYGDPPVLQTMKVEANHV